LSAMSGWDEIQRLAADLQRAQLSTGAVKLSERNCVEIVSKLVSLGLIDVIYTTDGKEYLTHQQLQKEISDEVYINGGRLELPELANILNVDFSQVEAQANQLVKNDSKRLFLVLGQLVNSHYLDRIAEEINDKLQLEGTVSISVITKDYNLPSDFVYEQVTSRLGSIIEGYADPNDPKVIVTPSYVARNKAKIRAVLRAVTVPTAINVICTRFQLESRLFFRLCDELILEGSAAGVLTGGRTGNKATYVPHVYARAQSQWVDAFFAQNGYLEYDALRRLGIADPQAYIRRKMTGQDDEVTYLSSCCVGRTIIDSLEANVEEALANGSYVDVLPFLPSVLSTQDTALLLQQFVTDGSSGKGSSRKRNSSSSAGKMPIVLAETVVTCQAFIDRLVEPFKERLDDKAAKAVNSGEYGKATKVGKAETKDFAASGEAVMDKKEERRKKAAGGAKAGGGTQGREGKTKSTKAKKGGKSGKKSQDQDWDSDNENEHKATSGGHNEEQVPEALKFMDAEEVVKALGDVSVLQDCPEEFVEALGTHLHPTLTKMYLGAAEELHRSTVSSSIQKKRKTHAEFQDKTLALYDNIRLFEKGLGNVKHMSLDKPAMEKYLVKSLCSDLVNGVFLHVASEAGVEATGADKTANQDLNAEQRIKLLGQIPKETAEHLLPIHKALGAGSVPEVIASLEDHLHDACDVLIKKVDKKKDKQVMFAHRQSLLDQIQSCQEPSQLLLLACLVIFQFQTGQMIHASGKFVPGLVSQISEGMEEEEGQLLKKYQSLVVDKMHIKPDQEEELSQIQTQLEELTPKVREVALNAKKSKN